MQCLTEKMYSILLKHITVTPCDNKGNKRKV